MKSFVFLLYLFFSSAVFASDYSTQGLVGDNAVPIVQDRSTLTNVPFGSLVYDNTDGYFFGLANTGSWQQLSVPNPIRSEVRLSTSGGRGSTNTAIRIYSNTIKNVGSDITYTTSATNGDTFTINTDGIYSISVGSGVNTSFNYALVGISVNSNQLTTSASAINVSNRLCFDSINLSGTSSVVDPSSSSCSWTGTLSSGDVVRSHTSAGSNSDPTTASQAWFSIVKMAN